MSKLIWWMRIVGAFYLFLFVAAAFLKIPIEVEGPPGVLEQAASGEAVARFVVDTFPGRAEVLVWTIIINEIVWGIGSDIYKISRGYEPAEPVVWIVIHSVIIITGIISLRKMKSVNSKPAGSPA